MVNMTGSADTLAAPFLTLAVMVEVLVPLAAMLVGLAVAVTVNGRPGAGLLVWSIVNEPLAPVPDSVAFTVQNPTVVLVVYVVASLPVASVVPEVGLTAPHDPVLLAVRVNVTVSPETAGLGATPPVTVAVMVKVAAPLAGAAPVPEEVTATLFGTAVWAIVAELLKPPLDSVAVTVHDPTVVLAL